MNNRKFLGNLSVYSLFESFYLFLTVGNLPKTSFKQVDYYLQMLNVTFKLHVSSLRCLIRHSGSHPTSCESSFFPN